MHARSESLRAGPSARLNVTTFTAAMPIALLVLANLARAQADGPASALAPPSDAVDEIFVVADPNRILPNAPSGSTFGFDKPMVETPRSVSMISEETIDLFGLTAVEDLVKLVPGVYTTTRFGIQGGVDVRNVPADTYFRGMKRLNLQGHARSVLAAMDTIEVVKGPPSPIFGMGKIGGYTNMSPKVGRVRDGGYMDAIGGFATGITGSYDRSESQFGVGGPLPGLSEREGAFYLFGLAEDSGTYARQVDVGQRLVQAASSIENVLGDFRLEFGGNYQRSTTAGSLLNRFSQDVVDTGRYVRGNPLVDLDLNGNGKVGYLEMHQATPVRGNISAANQPLIQRWTWPKDAAGNYLPLGEFPKVAGIPESLYNYLVAHPEADPTGALRAQGVGGPLPVSGYVPVGMALDPRTVGYDTLDTRRSDALERDLRADFRIAFIDLVNDANPDFTLKNQLFYDSMDQYKLSEQPGGGKQDVRVIEDKFTVTRRLMNTPDWLAVNTLGSLNYRYTNATGYRYGGDFSTQRTDVMYGDGSMLPTSTFVHAFENPDLNNDGAPWTSNYRTAYREAGVGMLFDIDLFEKNNVMVGTRYDTSRASNIDYAGTFNATTGRSSNPGAFRTAATRAAGRDSGSSWSISLSRELPYSIRPYLTVAESSLTLESSNNSMSNTVIQLGHIGEARLEEFGVKMAMLNEKLFFSTATYEQTRINVSENDDSSIVDAEVTSTVTEGWEAEFKWVPMSNAFLSFYILNQETRFNPVGGGNFLVNARLLGFQDVLDADGNVIFPAEAFLYGGRSFLVMPEDMPGYEIKRGNPETQLGLSGNYQLDNGLGFTFSSNHFSSVYTGRLMLVELPATTTFDAGAFMELGRFYVKLDVMNLTDERYFRARTGDTLSDAIAQAMPGRRWQATFRVTF